MVTTDEARIALEQARQKNESFKNQIVAARGDVLSEKSLITNRGIQAYHQRQLMLQRLGAGLNETSTQDAALGEYQNEIQRVESANKTIDEQNRQMEAERAALVADYDARVEALRLAKKAYYETKSPAWLGDNKLAWSYYQQLAEGKARAVEDSIADIERQMQMTLSPALREELRQKLRASATSEDINKLINQRFSNYKVIQPRQTLQQVSLPISQTNYVSTKLGIYDPATKTYYNEKTGLPVGVVTKPSGYSEYIKEKNPFTSTISFGTEKARGYLSEQEYKLGSHGQSIFAGETGEKVSMGVQFAPYFVPVTAPSFLFASGLGQLTPGGLKEASNIGENLQSKYNFPSSVGKYGFLGLTTIGGIYGARGLGTQISKAAGYPKYETIFFTKEYSKVPMENGELSILKSVAKTTQKNMLSNREFISGTGTLFKTGNQVESATPFISASKGKFVEFNRVLPKGSRFSKPITFAGMEQGTITQQKIPFLLNKNMKVYQEMEGFAMRSIGKSALYKKPSQLYASIGAGTMFDEANIGFLASKSVKYSKADGVIKFAKAGVIQSRGFFKPVEQQPTFSEFFGGNLKTITKAVPKETLIEQQAKQAVERAVSQYAATKPISPLLKNTVGAGVLSASSLKESSAPVPSSSLYYGTGQYETTNVMGFQTIPAVQQDIKTSQTIQPVIKISSVSSVAPISESRLKLSQIQTAPEALQQPSAIKPMERTALNYGEAITPAEAQLQRQNQLLRLRQEQIASQNMQQRIATPRPIIPPIFPGIDNKKKSVLSKVKAAFDVFIKRRGKEVKIGSALPLGLAKRAGVMRNVKDLSASFTLRPRGTTTMEDINFNVPSRIFAPSKRNRNWFVQQRRFRLSSRSEVSDIMSAKRSKRFKWF